MRRAGFHGAFWPTPLQEELLRTALLPGDEARAAWRRIRPALDLDDLWDPEVHRILPLVHRALRDLRIDDPDLPRLKGLARRAWYENQLRMNGVAPVVALLEERGVPTMLLKGMPLALAYYGDLSLRPMRDVDVLVPTGLRDDARRILAAEGWTAHRQEPSLSHGEGVAHRDGRSIDLHWHVGMPFVLPRREAASDDDFWRAADPLEMAGVATRMPCPSDMLLHVCVHGAWSGSGSTVRWITDAMRVLRVAGGRLDWDRVIDQIERRRLGLLLREPFRYLAGAFGAPVPGDVIDRVAAMPDTRAERARHRRATWDVAPRPVLGRLPLTVAQWSYASAKWSRPRAAREFPRFLRDHWGLASLRELPPEALRKAARRIALLRTGAAPADDPQVR